MTAFKFTAMTPALYQYLLDVSQPLSADLSEMEAANQSHPQIHMQIAADQAQFLQFLIKTKSMHRILELGTFLGFSTAAMALALPKDGLIVTCDLDAQTVERARQQWDKHHISHKINTMIGPALASLHTLIDAQQTFDLIFIDADKSNYPAYYQLAKQLLEPAGIIAVDNTLFHGEVLDPKHSKAATAIHDFNQMVKNDPEVEAVLLTIADGLTLIQLK